MIVKTTRPGKVNRVECVAIFDSLRLWVGGVGVVGHIPLPLSTQSFEAAEFIWHDTCICGAGIFWLTTNPGCCKTDGMDLIQQGIAHFGTAADLARATKYTPQAISIARKRMAAKIAAGKPATIPAGLSKAIRRAIARQRKRSV